MRIDNRLAAAGVMLALFVSGGVTGGVLVHLVEQGTRPDARWERRDDDEPDMDGRRRGRRPGDPRSFATERAVERLAERLELTGEQRDAVQAILEGQRAAAGEVFQEMAPRLQSLVDSTHARIRGLLDDEQRARFEELLRVDRGLLGRPPPQPPDSAVR
jgi:predicted dehydrogenase